jgi:DNA replication protein DnaC
VSGKATTCWPSGRPASGKTHVIAGIGHALIDRGYKILFMRTSEMIQRLQAARRDLRLPAELAKLDRFDLLILPAGIIRKPPCCSN